MITENPLYMTESEQEYSPKERTRQEMEQLLEEAYWRVHNRGQPLSASATGGDMQAAGMFWRVCRVALYLAETDPEEILATRAAENGIREMLKAIALLRTAQREALRS